MRYKSAWKPAWGKIPSRNHQTNQRPKSALAFLLFSLFLFACQNAPSEASPPPPLPSSTQEALPPEELRIGTTPYLSPAQLEEAYQQLLAQLEEKLGIKTRLVITQSYEELLGLIKAAQVEIAVLPPYLYTLAKEELPALSPLVSPISGGTESSGAYLFTRRDSEIHTLSDLRGKSLAFVDPYSTTGYLFPLVELLDAGLNPSRDLERIIFLGNHDRVIEAVYQKEVDAGTTYSGALERALAQKDIPQNAFRIIDKGTRSPHEVWAAVPSLSEGFAKKLREELLQISTTSAKGRLILEALRANGFVPADDRSYDEVREAARRVREALGDIP